MRAPPATRSPTTTRTRRIAREAHTCGHRARPPARERGAHHGGAADGPRASGRDQRLEESRGGLGARRRTRAGARRVRRGGGVLMLAPYVVDAFLLGMGAGLLLTLGILG